LWCMSNGLMNTPTITLRLAFVFDKKISTIVDAA
jgi:hypothetical protein